MTSGRVTQLINMRATAKQRGCDRKKWQILCEFVLSIDLQIINQEELFICVELLDMWARSRRLPFCWTVCGVWNTAAMTPTGIAVCGAGTLRVEKSRGRLQVLSDLTHEGADLPGTVGIGHTRWATHGEPNDINAHPHVSQSGKIAVVHNGIIENYIELKEQLLHKGYTFRSETDTEVVAQLLDYYYTDCGDIFEAMVRMLHAVDGSYALGIICADFPDRLLCARKDAPLLLGFGEGENFIASDVTAIITPHARRRLPRRWRARHPQCKRHPRL